MLAIFGLALLSLANLEAVAAAREKILLNSGWSFALVSTANSGAGKSDTESRSAVDLPHTWNATDANDKTKPYYRGIGNYRKRLVIPRSLSGKVLYLYFEGVNQVASVSVNGKHAGRHVGGYSAFAVDISGLVSFGRENVIDVRVDNRHSDNIPPLNADFTFYGGIYRDVWLVALDGTHFNLDEYAATDFTIDTIVVSSERAIIEIQAGVANGTGKNYRVLVDSVLLNAEGAVIAKDTRALVLTAESVSNHKLARLKVENPKLWSPESPYLYSVKSSIRDGEVVLDEVRYRVGLRWFEVDARKGFILNGKPYRLYGTNRHQDYPGLGSALPNELHREDLEKIKANGFNFLRLAHYPQDPDVLRAADELGLLVWEETPIVNLISQSGEFRRNSTRMVREMIRQHRHHPSIAFWGYMNEVTLREPDPLPEHYYEDVVALARELNNVAKSEDPTRPTAMALSRDEVGNGVPLAGIADVLGLNLYFGWYYETFGSLGEFLDRYHGDHPETPLFVSEYGAGSDERVHSRRPASFDFSIEYQQRFHEENFRQILDRPWLIGSAVWNQFDFGSNHRQDTKFAINQKGLWFFDRTPKDIAYYYKAHLSSHPVLHLATRDWRRRAGSRRGDATMPVRVYSNAASMELFINGRSQGVKTVQNATAEWLVELNSGDNHVVARSGSREDWATIHYQDRSAMFDSAAAPMELAINAGGNEQIVGYDNRVWEADSAYDRGSWGYLGGTGERSHRRIIGTEDDPLYQTRRTGSHSYRFDVPDGTYRLEFHFAELNDASGDGHCFDIDTNGMKTAVLIRAPFERHITSAEIEVSGGNGLFIQLTDGTARAGINGIVLRRIVGLSE